MTATRTGADLLALLTGGSAAGATTRQAPGALASHFPNVTLVTSEARRVRFYDDLIKGKVVLVNFMFTTCTDICPTTTRGLRAVQDRLDDEVGRRIFMYSITVDPDHDSPAVLKKFAQDLGVRRGWEFLTGRAADIDAIRQGLGVFDAGADRATHMGLLTLGSERAGRWIMLPALSSPDEIASALRRLLPAD